VLVRSVKFNIHPQEHALDSGPHDKATHTACRVGGGSATAGDAYRGGGADTPPEVHSGGCCSIYPCGPILPPASPAIPCTIPSHPPTHPGHPPHPACHQPRQTSKGESCKLIQLPFLYLCHLKIWEHWLPCNWRTGKCWECQRRHTTVAISSPSRER
jgi:hypothetical protein